MPGEAVPEEIGQARRMADRARELQEEINRLGAGNPQWCEPDQCPAAICGGPHEVWKNPASGDTVTVRTGQPVPHPGFTEKIIVTSSASGPGTPARERLDSAIADGHEQLRLATSALGAADMAAAAAHCQAGILGLLLAIGETFKEEPA